MNNQWSKRLRFVIILLSIYKVVFCSTIAKTNKIEKWLVPQIDGSVKYMDEKEATKMNLDSSPPMESSNLNVFFFLYTNIYQNMGEVIQMNDLYSLQQSNFSSQLPTRIIIHGWRGHLNSPVNKLIRDAYLSIGYYNIFIVDWGSIANTLNYIKARYNVKFVGQHVAKFIDFLHRDGKMNFNDLIVIGHSLGAHIAGISGQYIKTGTIPIIYGLDPAYPLFSYDEINERLSIDDADYVETIQTNAGRLGFKNPIGKTSFYPNWGKIQKGCGIDWNGMCSHRRSYKYFAELVKNNNFISDAHCDSLDKLWDKKCNVMMSRKIRMGDQHNSKLDVKGIYYVKTNSKEPFGLA